MELLMCVLSFHCTIYVSFGVTCISIQFFAVHSMFLQHVLHALNS